jgi:hypothetical protein
VAFLYHKNKSGYELLMLRIITDVDIEVYRDGKRPNLLSKVGNTIITISNQDDLRR